MDVLDMMSISYTCDDCELQIETESPVYTDDLRGEFVEFACESCSHDYTIYLEEN